MAAQNEKARSDLRFDWTGIRVSGGACLHRALERVVGAALLGHQTSRHVRCSITTE